MDDSKSSKGGKTVRKQRSGQLQFIVQLAALLIVNYFLYLLYFRYRGPFTSTYYEPSITFEWFKSEHLVPIYLVLISLTFAQWFSKSWADTGINSATRWLIVLSAGLLTWEYSCYDYNFFFNQGHYIDRGLLILCFVLSIRHPAFISPLLCLVFAISNQFNTPLGMYTWIDKYMPIGILILTHSFLLLGAQRVIQPRVFVLAVICLVGGSYFGPGVKKILVGPTPVTWILENPLDSLFVSGYVNGWLGDLSEETIVAIAQAMRPFNVLSLLATVIIELAGIVLLLHPLVSRLALASFILLHALIMASTGVFFWHWMIIDLYLLFAIVKIAQNGSDLFKIKVRYISVIVILFCVHIFHQRQLGWFDTRVNNFFEFELADSNGEYVQVSRNFFSPYDVVFSLSEFFYVLKDKKLVGTYGTAPYDIYTHLENSTPEDVSKIREHYGDDVYDQKEDEKLVYFLTMYLKNFNEKNGEEPIINKFAAPYHLQHWFNSAPIKFKAPVTKLRIRYVETYYDGKSIKRLQDRVLGELDVPQKSES